VWVVLDYEVLSYQIINKLNKEKNMNELNKKTTLPIRGVMPHFSSVLSLFDGMSCGQIALNRVGIKYDHYFASEIDKFAIKVTQTNYD